MLFIEDGAPVIVQGMTGHQGMTHTCLLYTSDAAATSRV